MLETFTAASSCVSRKKFLIFKMIMEKFIFWWWSFLSKKKLFKPIMELFLLLIFKIFNVYLVIHVGL